MLDTIKNTKTIELQGESKMSQVSMLKGYWFYFKHNGNDISVHGSSWSGKEVVYLNNHPVSIKRNITSRKTIHYFSLDGVDYRVEIFLKSFLTGEVETKLYASEECIGSESLAIRESKQNSPWYKAVGFTALFFVIGVAFGYFAISYIMSLIGS